MKSGIMNNFIWFFDSNRMTMIFIFQYLGDIARARTSSINIAMFSYRFVYPESVTLNEEYYVISFLSLIGWVGGTMGMFFGFSFSGALSTILDFLEMICLKISDNGNN